MTQVIKDIEEALKREVASITTFHKDTKTSTTIKTTYDPFTGEIKKKPLEASFYDESSHANAVTYPRVDISLEEIREDRESGRMISIWEDYFRNNRSLIEPNQNRPKVYQQVVSSRNGQNDGDGLVVSSFNLNKIKANHLVKIINGNNKGTYKIKSIDSVNSKVVLDDELVTDIQELAYLEEERKLYLLNPTDIFAVRSGDIFEDSLGNQFKIIDIDTKCRELYLSGNTEPDLNIGSKIIRSGNVLRNTDTQDIFYIVMDPDKEIFTEAYPNINVTDQYLTSHPPTPFNYIYNIEIKNIERNAHTEVAERMTETIMNRPRRAIYLLLRTENSAETDIKCGSSFFDGRTIEVESIEHFKINDSVYLVNRFNVSENNQIIDIDKENKLIYLRNRVPFEFDLDNKARIVSNANLRDWQMFFQEGSTIISKDVQNNFYRQQYSIRIEGWKAEKSGKIVSGAITQVQGTLETPNDIEEDFKS